MGGVPEVVITGMGAITSVGVGVAALREAGETGRSGIEPITQFNTDALPVKFAGVAKAFDPASVLDAKQVRLAARVVQLAIGAALEATGSDTLGALGDVTRVGTIIGTSTGGIEVIAEQMEQLSVKGPRRVSPFAVPQLMDNAAAGWVAVRWGFRGPAYSIATASSTSLDALGIAFDMIRSGRLDACLAGGAEGEIVPYIMATFARAGLLSNRNEDPAHATRPFDLHRDGFALGEGAGLLMLETRERAEKRGARILARVLGYGATSHPTANMLEPQPDGRGLAKATEIALAQAGISASDVGYIAAHGAGSKLEDASEAAAIHTAYGKHAEKIPVGAVTSMVGFTLAAAGALSVEAAVLAVRDGVLMPNITFRDADPACRLNLVAGKAGHASVKYAVANAMGYGGHSACLVLGAA